MNVRNWLLRGTAFALRAVLPIVLCAVFHTGQVAAQTLTVASPSAQCGKTVNVNVSISSTSGLLAVQFKISYDKTKLTATGVTSGALTSSFSLASNLGTAGLVTVAMASGSPVNGSGNVATIAFSTAAAASGETDVSISEILVNDVSKSGNDGTVSITCVQTPAAPTYLSPSNNATGVAAPVKLRWNASSGATGYLVYLGTGTPSLYDSTSATSMDVDTATGTTYKWYVRAENSAGTSAPGATWTFTTAGPLCETPPAPAISAPGSVSSGSAYDVTWTGIANASDYVLDEAANSSFTGAVATTTTALKATVTKSVAANTTWYYRVRARNNAAGCTVNGPYSGTAAVTVSPKPPIPQGANLLVVVGSNPGALGAMFRTSMQLHNPSAGRLRGKIVFHVAGSSGGDSDAFLPYDLAPGETISFLDLLPAMGITSGLGSADLVPDPLGSPLPLFVTRIYNDGGANGTSGMTLEAGGLDDVLFAGQSGVVVAPMDPAKMRMNIGIRTLADGATFTVTMRDRSGTVVTSKRVGYGPTWFIQPSAEGLMGVPMTADATLTFVMEAGAAMIYASTTDNTTQDTQVQIARPVS